MLNDPQRTRDVRAKVQALADIGKVDFTVGTMAADDDPAGGVVKTLVVEYTIGGKAFTTRATDPEPINLKKKDDAAQVVDIRRDADGQPLLNAWQPGKYELKTASGRILRGEVDSVPAPREITGPWDLRFPPNWGAPAQVTLDKLISWSEHPDAGVKHFSGTATYFKTISLSANAIAKNRRLYLDLGKVAVMAEVRINGKALGILWKSPFRVDVTDVMRSGDNAMEVKVVNLWINRIIGDEQFPDDCSWYTCPWARGAALKEWPAWLLKNEPRPEPRRLTFATWKHWHKDDPLVESGLLGPVTIHTALEIAVRP